MDGWMDGWLAGWLAGWPAVWLAGWLAGQGRQPELSELSSRICRNFGSIFVRAPAGRAIEQFHPSIANGLLRVLLQSQVQATWREGKWRRRCEHAGREGGRREGSRLCLSREHPLARASSLRQARGRKFDSRARGLPALRGPRWHPRAHPCFHSRHEVAREARLLRSQAREVHSRPRRLLGLRGDE